MLVVIHVAIHPFKAWNRRPYGGIILGHEAKFSLELTKSKAKRKGESAEDGEFEESRDERDDSGRAFWVARHPAMQEYSKSGVATIDEEGFH